MTGDQQPTLQALTSFTASVGYDSRQTVLTVSGPGLPQPVAQLAKVGPVRARAAYELFTGPALNRPAGQVTPSGAQNTDGTAVGIVNLSAGRVADRDIHPMSGARHTYVVHNPALWRVVPTGSPPLTGHAVGRATRLCFNRLTDLSERTGIGLWTPDFLVSLTFQFSAPDSAGFTVTRLARRARFEVTVADPLLDRRLVLACLTAMTALITWTARAELTDMTSTFRPRQQ